MTYVTCSCNDLEHPPTQTAHFDAETSYVLMQTLGNTAETSLSLIIILMQDRA